MLVHERPITLRMGRVQSYVFIHVEGDHILYSPRTSTSAPVEPNTISVHLLRFPPGCLLRTRLEADRPGSMGGDQFPVHPERGRTGRES